MCRALSNHAINKHYTSTTKYTQLNRALHVFPIDDRKNMLQLQNQFQLIKTQQKSKMITTSTRSTNEKNIQQILKHTLRGNTL